MVYRDGVNTLMASASRRSAPLCLMVLALTCGALTTPALSASNELLVASDGGAPFSTLSSAVAAAAPGSIIRVRPGLYHETVIVDKNLTVVGMEGTRAVILDGENRRALIKVVGPAVLRCENLEFRHGLAEFGPAVHIDGDAVADFLNCTFHDNVARADAGAVAVTGAGAWAEFVGCHFQRNRAADNGGAVSARLGAELTFRGCTFFANVAGGSCGAVDAQGDAPLLVEHCLFIENEGLTAGAVRTAGGAVRLEGNTFFRNLSLSGATVSVASATDDHTVAVLRNILCGDLEGSGLALPMAAERSCNLYYDNFGGPLLNGVPNDQELVANPEFCDFRGLDLTLRRNSPATGQTTDCGRIGALDVGCLESMEAASWTGPAAPHRLVR